jgi:hypothetical protein
MHCTAAKSAKLKKRLDGSELDARADLASAISAKVRRTGRGDHTHAGAVDSHNGAGQIEVIQDVGKRTLNFHLNSLGD